MSSKYFLHFSASGVQWIPAPVLPLQSSRQANYAVMARVVCFVCFKLMTIIFAAKLIWLCILYGRSSSAPPQVIVVVGGCLILTEWIHGVAVRSEQPVLVVVVVVVVLPLLFLRVTGAFLGNLPPSLTP